MTGFNLAASEPDDISSVKDKIKAKMSEQGEKDKIEKESGKKFKSEEYGIPYNLVFTQNGKLVVGIDASKTKEFDKKYSIEDVKRDLGTSQDLQVNYFVFQREAGVYGGDIVRNTDDTVGSDGSGGFGTITLITSSNKMIVTGHLGILGEHIAAGPRLDPQICAIGTISYDPSATREFADSAYINMVSNPACPHTFSQNTIKYGSNTYSVTDGTLSDITLNKFIRMAGVTTPTSSGYILDTDVTAKDNQGILDNQVVANYPSADGDSGAPVFTVTGSSTVKILGQHVGKFYLVDLNSGDTFGYWSPPLTVFSPWPYVKSNLGL